MTDAERQALQDDLATHLSKASTIAAILAGADIHPLPPISRDVFVSLKIAAAAWGITEDAARKKVKRLARERPEWVTKRGAGRWWVHREALR